MTNPDKNELLQKFLDNELSPDEILLFRDLFHQNKDFACEVKQYTNMKLVLRAASKLNLTHNLQSAPQTQQTKSGSFNFSARIWAIAASIALLIAASGYYLLTRQVSALNKDLYAMHYTNPFSSPEVLTRSPSAEIDTTLLTDFTQAINLMENRKFKMALSILTRLDKQHPNPLSEEIEWYLALCNLRMGNTDIALGILANIHSSNSIHSQKAYDMYLQLTNN